MFRIRFRKLEVLENHPFLTLEFRGILIYFTRIMAGRFTESFVPGPVPELRGSGKKCSGIEKVQLILILSGWNGGSV